MPRSALLFSMKRKERPPAESLRRILEVTIADLEKHYEDRGRGLELRRLRILLRKVGEVRFSEVIMGDRLVQLGFTYPKVERIPRMEGAKRAYEHLELKHTCICWMRFRSFTVAIFDVRDRSLADSICELMSLAIYGDPGLIVPLRFSREDMLSIESWSTSTVHEVTGSVIRIVMDGVNVGDAVLDEVNVKRWNLSYVNYYRRLRESARGFKSLTIVTPMLEEIGTQLTCRIDRRGRITIYTPKVELSSFDVLLNKIEDALGLVYP